MWLNTLERLRRGESVPMNAIASLDRTLLADIIFILNERLRALEKKNVNNTTFGHGHSCDEGKSVCSCKALAADTEETG